MTLAADQQRVARLQRIDTAQDRLGPVGDLGRVGARAGHDGGTDQGRVLGPGVVVGDDHHIGMIARGLAHQRALAPVAVAARADDADDAPHHMRTQRLQRGDHRARLVGVIHKDRRTVLALRDQLHPAPYGGQLRQHAQDVVGAVARGQAQAHRRQHVFRLEPADQRQPHQMRPPHHREPQILPRRVIALAQDAQHRGLSGADGGQGQAAIGRDVGHLAAALAVDVDDGSGAVLQHAVEQKGLGREIFVKARVVIQVILAEIGEGPGLDPHPVQAALIQSVAGGLHRGMGDARGDRLGQDAVQGQRIGGGMGKLRLVIALDPHRAQADRLVAQRLPDLAGEAGHAGLAAGAGDGHDMVGLIGEPQRRGAGQGCARILGHDQRPVPARQDVGGDLGALTVGQDGGGLHAQRVLDEFAAMDGRSRQGREQVPGLDRAAVDGQPRDPRVTPTGGAQPQLRQRHVVLVHSPTRH